MHKNLNDIIPPSRRRAMSGSDAGFQDSSAPSPTSYQSYGEPRGRGRKRFPFGTAIIALIVIAACAGALYAFAGAKVTITPAENSATVSGDFTATPSGGDLPYEVVSVEKVGSQSVPSESTETVNQAAQGTITISNEQANPQALITNTRFQTADGLVFRIHQAVNVPAAKNGTAGTATATVYADQTGDKYNVGPTTFSLPGLSGSKAFTLVTAKSVEAMAGGFSGTRASVSQSTKDAQDAKIQSSLAGDLQSDLAAKIPTGYVLVPGSSFVSYTAQPDQAGSSGQVNLSVKGSMTAVIFPSDALAKAIAYQVVGTYAGQPVKLAATDKLTLKPSSTGTPDGSQDFAFNLSGSTSIVWQVDATKIAAAVAGKTRDSAQVVLSGFPEVDKATLVLRPFWKGAFPADPAHVTVIVTDATAK